MSSPRDIEDLNDRIKSLESKARDFLDELNVLEVKSRDLKDRFFEINNVLRTLRNDADKMMGENKVSCTQIVSYTEAEKKDKYICIIVGELKLGKSSYLKKLSTGEFSDHYIPTLGMDDIELEFNVRSQDDKVNKGKVKFFCFDFSGNKEYNAIFEDISKDCDCALIFYSGTSGIRDYYEWRTKLMNSKRGMEVIPVINYIKESDMPCNGNIQGTSEISVKNEFNLISPFVELVKKLWKDDNISLELPNESNIEWGVNMTQSTENLYNPICNQSHYPPQQNDNDDSDNGDDDDDTDDDDNETDDVSVELISRNRLVYDVGISIMGLDNSRNDFYKNVSYGEGNISAYQKVINDRNVTFSIRNETKFPIEEYDPKSRNFIVVTFDCTNPNAGEDISHIARFIQQEHYPVLSNFVRVIIIGMNSDALTREELNEKILEWEGEDECPYALMKPKVVTRDFDYNELFGEYFSGKGYVDKSQKPEDFMAFILMHVREFLNENT